MNDIFSYSFATSEQLVDWFVTLIFFIIGVAVAGVVILLANGLRIKKNRSLASGGAEKLGFFNYGATCFVFMCLVITLPPAIILFPMSGLKLSEQHQNLLDFQKEAKDVYGLTLSELQVVSLGEQVTSKESRGSTSTFIKDSITGEVQELVLRADPTLGIAFIMTPTDSSNFPEGLVELPRVRN